MTTQRTMQVDEPAEIPAPGPRPSRLLESPDEARDRQAAQLAGAVSALAGKFGRLEEHVGAMQRPAVRPEDRLRALNQARAFVSELEEARFSAALDRIRAELFVARYLTGE